MKQNQNDKCGTRFVKGRKQEALAQIEGWVGGSREELIKGKYTTNLSPELTLSTIYAKS